MRKAVPFSVLILSIFAVVAASTLQNQNFEGPQRVFRMDGRHVDGDVTFQNGVYEIRTRHGVVVTLRKNEVQKIEPLVQPVPGTRSSPAPAPIDSREHAITPDDVAYIIGEVSVDPEDIMLGGGDPGRALPVNEESVAEMERIAGAGAKVARLETDHFVLVYTSDKSIAVKLASRLESVYRWNVRILDMLSLPFHQPEYKLEVYFFGKHDEFARYTNLLGMQDSVGLLGFFVPTLNRSCFFDMETWPPIASRHERIKDKSVPFRERQFVRNETNRWTDWKNLEVVQHEAAHHIHFNIGVFQLEAFEQLPRWTVEGLATMFELPPSAAGASFGAVNHPRLDEFRRFFGNRGQNGPDLLRFLLDDNVFLSGGGRYYPYAWAVTTYLWKEKREGYARWMAALAKRGDEKEFGATEKQRIFEDCFGAIDEEWSRKFFDYLDSLQLRRSILPPEIF